MTEIKWQPINLSDGQPSYTRTEIYQQLREYFEHWELGLTPYYIAELGNRWHGRHHVEIIGGFYGCDNHITIDLKESDWRTTSIGLRYTVCTSSTGWHKESGDKYCKFTGKITDWGADSALEAVLRDIL